jgi:hypothetical protein
MPAAIAVLAALSGCTGHDMVTTVSRPGKFKLLNCAELNKRGTELLRREGELNGLMQKARQGPGGELAIAIAYQNEYNIVQGDLHEIERAGAEKNCELKHRSASERAIR